MGTVWSVETRGDPLNALNRFIQCLWQETDLDGMIVASEALGEGGARIRVLEQPEQFHSLNLFRPVMGANIAREVPESIRARPNARFGVILRPCERRALDVIAQLDPFPQEQLWTISVDCLGAFPASDFEWRAERKGAGEELSRDALRFARLGGMAIYRYRPACQVCRSPGAEAADINIGVVGLPIREFMLVELRQNKGLQRPSCESFPLVEASLDLVHRRKRVLSRMVARNRLTCERFVHGLVELLPDTLDALAAHLDRCGDCQECLRVCPICSVRPIRRRVDGHYDRDEIAHWLVVCAGCGMCEQACPKNLPLSAIFSLIREQLVGQYSDRVL